MTQDTIIEHCGLSPLASFVLRLLILYEWDHEFSHGIDEIGVIGSGQGIPLNLLTELWMAEEKENEGTLLEDPGIALIAEQLSSDQGRSICYRLRVALCRMLAADLDMGVGLCSYAHYYDKCELEREEDPDMVIYPGLLRLALKSRQEQMPFLLMQVAGKKGSGRIRNLKCFCRELGRGLLLILGSELQKLDREERKEALKSLLLESLIGEKELALYWNEDPEPLSQIIKEACEAWYGYSVRLTLIMEQPVSWQGEGIWSCESAVFTLEEPDRYQTMALWQRTMANYELQTGPEMDELVHRYRFTPGQIRQTLDSAKNMAWSRGKDKITKQELALSCRLQTEYRFAGKAVRVKACFEWKDLILADESKDLLRDICNQNRYWSKVYGEWGFRTKFSYGLGNSLLFAGPPGTGKTMAAQVMASELDIELFRVDLSTVVSKYIGETEKNLNLVFDEAAKSLCILFFDEADVLFGKRTEVKDSQDKYSNMEAAFLLQKMEEYDGISILATNFQQNIDEAFKRRIKYMIEFSIPDVHQRKKMWIKAFPEQAPVDKSNDYDFLAKQFKLTGSNIKNIAVNAAFMAAAEQTQIGMKQIIKALRNEYKKSGKRLTKEELEQYGMY